MHGLKSWLCTCYKCVRFQVNAEQDFVLYERIKDKKERSELYADLRGRIKKQQDGYTGENEYMQMLADMGATTGTNSDIEINVKNKQDIVQQREQSTRTSFHLIHFRSLHLVDAAKS